VEANGKFLSTAYDKLEDGEEVVGAQWFHNGPLVLGSLYITCHVSLEVSDA
jgi:hypothetical protein